MNSDPAFLRLGVTLALLLLVALYFRAGDGAGPDGQSTGRSDERSVRLDDGSRFVLKSLREQGDRPDCPREIDHFLYPAALPAFGRAALIDAIRARDGWKAEDFGDGGVRATVTSPATAHRLAEQIDLLHGLGARSAFVYDGWETAPTTGC